MLWIFFNAFTMTTHVNNLLKWFRYSQYEDVQRNVGKYFMNSLIS